MKRIVSFLLLNCYLITNGNVYSQNAVLLSLGTPDCNALVNPVLFSIKDPLGINPQLLTNCALSPVTPDPFNVFVAYNPASNKAFVADVRSGTDTKIWVTDLALPNNINCAGALPISPTYSYAFSSNNFEFDNDGNLWSLDGINFINGQSVLDKIDVNTGAIIDTRILQFPPDHIPYVIESGDLCILPNGRMFAVLGVAPSKLYEITNYSGLGTATAIFLADMPRDCYGIAYVNGSLQLTGFSNTAGAACFYFEYNISSQVLSTEKVFPLGRLPTDNSGFTANVGTSKRLLSARMVNANTYDISYELYIENLGNVRLNDVNLFDDLAAVFGVGNVSNVQTEFAIGGNPAGLILNSGFNGTTDRNLFPAGQILFNKNATNANYFARVQLRCRVTNLASNTTYRNSAVGTGSIGSAVAGTLINVSDSSNNGNAAAIDPDFDGNANEVGENIPTPFTFSVLPVQFIRTTALLRDAASSIIQWEVAVPMNGAKHFEVEWSSDGRKFTPIGTVPILNLNQPAFQFSHERIPVGLLFYRIKQIDIDGAFIYSAVVRLHNRLAREMISIQSNTSGDGFYVTNNTAGAGELTVQLYDGLGRLRYQQDLIVPATFISTSHLSKGVYVVLVQSAKHRVSKKIFVGH